MTTILEQLQQLGWKPRNKFFFSGADDYCTYIEIIKGEKSKHIMIREESDPDDENLVTEHLYELTTIEKINSL